MALSDLCPKVTYEVKKICCCEVIDDKNPSKNIFRIVRQSKDGSFKNLDFEAPSAITSMHCFTFRVLWVVYWVDSFGWAEGGGSGEEGRRGKVAVKKEEIVIGKELNYYTLVLFHYYFLLLL